MQYSNFKDTLQNIASQIGNVEQEVEEHKYVASARTFHSTLSSLQTLFPRHAMQTIATKSGPLASE
jgi:hypothetical protein